MFGESSGLRKNWRVGTNRVLLATAASSQPAFCCARNASPSQLPVSPTTNGSVESQPAGEPNAFVMKVSDSLEPKWTTLYQGQGAGLLQGVGGLARLLKSGDLYVGLSMSGGYRVGGISHTSQGERDIVLLRYGP